MKYCECGCGAELDLTKGRKVKKFIKGHAIRVRNKAAEARKGKSSWNKGIPRTDEEKKTLSRTIKAGIAASTYKMSDETKKLISDKLKGRVKSKEWVAKIIQSRINNPGYENTKKRISDTIKSKLKDGSLINPWYIDGRYKNDPCSPYNLYGGEFTNELKVEVRLRDNYTCQLCGKKRSTTVHHIDYNKLNNIKENLITLCKSCHIKHHHLTDKKIQLIEQIKLNKIIDMMKNEIALTYDDIQLVPEFSDVKSRQDISLRTLVSRRYGLMNPIVAAPMDTVCDAKMTWKMFVLGGAGVIHRFMTVSEQVDQVKEVYERMYKTDEGEKYLELWGVMYDDWHSEIPYPPIMAAIGVQASDRQRAKYLIEAGVNILVIDVAHGHHKKVIDMIKWCKSNLKDTVDIIAGNIATSNAVRELEEAGVDGLRCGIGGGSLCCTRLQTGFGVPNVTSLINITQMANVPIMADGGIRTSGDIAKALAIGADCVMIGSLIAGTDEAPGNIIETPQGLYKRYRGSASLDSKQANGGNSNNVEGESTLIPYKGGVKFIINGLTDGIKSALSYGGANNLKEFNPQWTQITSAGVAESKPHGIK